jgi:predicted transcriptional regulator
MKRTVDVDVIIGYLQARIMQYLWLADKATVQQVMTALNQVNYEKKQQPLAYTTYLTVLRNLAKRGFVDQRKADGPGPGHAHFFTPKITKASFRERFAKHIVDTYFEGNATLLVESLPDSV